jgi:hypothetical protein
VCGGEQRLLGCVRRGTRCRRRRVSGVFRVEQQLGKIYVYTHGSYALSDSVNVGQTTGPSAIRIATF